jgi:hypothetical protein
LNKEFLERLKPDERDSSTDAGMLRSEHAGPRCCHR